LGYKKGHFGVPISSYDLSAGTAGNILIVEVSEQRRWWCIAGSAGIYRRNISSW